MIDLERTLEKKLSYLPMELRSFFVALCIAAFASFSSSIAKQSNSSYLFILGVVQDAGFPQAGCYQPHCLPGWQDARLRRGATSVALIDQSAKKKYVFEATPHLPAQLYALEQEAPSSEFPLSGFFLTHAHIGHYAGLMFLGHESMGVKNMPVFARPK